MADRPPWGITEKLDMFVKGLPDDRMRLAMLQALWSLGGRARVADLAKKVSGDAPGEVAPVIIAAARDGLVQFTEDHNAVAITELGARLADRQSRGAG